MIEEEEHPDDTRRYADLLQRLDYQEMRTAAHIDRLETRIGQLETELRAVKDSGDADLHRLRKLGSRILSREERIGQDGEALESKPFPIRMRYTAIALIVLTGIITAVRSNNYESANEAEMLGLWFGTFLFCAAIPALVAYLVAGRKEQHSRSDRWFFWGAAITSLWTVILTIATLK